MEGIKNIIFDLGGVLLDIDYKKTTAAFEAIGYRDFEKMFSQYKLSPMFEDLETGKIPEDEFLENLIRLSTLSVTRKAVLDAWNAMLLEFRTESLVNLTELSGKYELYLLSNTNSIHISAFRKIFTRDTGKPTLDDYFRKAWYSHEIGLRKPYREVYEFVLREGNMEPGETFFIDDTTSNIEMANEIGIRTHLLKPGERIGQLAL